MDQKSIDLLITEAKQKLTNNPFDSGHDLPHAEAVWATAQDIVGNVRFDPGSKSAHDPGSSINLDALKIACNWHDVVVKPKNALNPAGHNVADTAAYLKNRLEALKFPTDFTTLTINAVRFHQFDDEPVNLEGQILWDADKLEVININRWLAAKKAVDAGKMPQSKLDAYTYTALEWLKVLRPKYHFDYSRSLFDQRLKILISDPGLQALAREKNLDIQTIINQSK